MAIFYKYRSVLLYGMGLALVLLLLRWLEWEFIIVDNSFEMYVGIIAIVFTLLGVWLSVKLSRPQVIMVEKAIAADTGDSLKLNEKAISEFGLSKRELEVLALMARGLSNQEIAGRLYVSLNTVKTHSSNIFLKLDVQRRTQAIEKARRLNLLIST